jgi:hypothetical protein
VQACRGLAVHEGNVAVQLLRELEENQGVRGGERPGAKRQDVYGHGVALGHLEEVASCSRITSGPPTTVRITPSVSTAVRPWKSGPASRRWRRIRSSTSRSMWIGETKALALPITTSAWARVCSRP